MPEAWYVRANCRHKLGALDQAIADFRQAAEAYAQSDLEPEERLGRQVCSHVLIAECYVVKGRRNDAYKALEPIYELFGERPPLAGIPRLPGRSRLGPQVEALLTKTRELIDEKTPLEPSKGAQEFLEYLETQ